LPAVGPNLESAPVAPDRLTSPASVVALGLLLTPLLPGAATAQTRWPERIPAGEAAFTFDQPQADRWDDDRLEARAAVAAVRTGEKDPTYGVVWLHARTALGPRPGEVTLGEIEVTKASFPWERDGGKELLEALRRSAASTATIPLACLNASPAVTLASRRVAPAPPPESEPRVIHARGPAILVLVDGDYDIRRVPGTSVLRVSNTRALLLQDAASSRFYLPLGHVWLVAPAPNGKWTIAKRLPQGLEAVRKAAAAEPGVELFEKPGEDVAALLSAGKSPAVFVSTTPAVLASKLPKSAVRPPAASSRPRRGGGLFAGPDGNVYRPRPGGGWDKTNGRDWYPVQEPAGRRLAGNSLIARLDAELRARAAGWAEGPPERRRP